MVYIFRFKKNSIALLCATDILPRILTFTKNENL